MTTPRIALIRQKYRDDGGAERFVSRALEALGQINLDVTLIARKWQSSKNFRHLKCDPFYLGRLWRDRSFAKCVCTQVSTHQFELVQSHERLACCNLYRAGDGVHREWLKQRARILPALSGKALWLSPYHRYTMRAEKEMFESDHLRAVICNSKMVRDEILDYFDIAPEKMHIIYSGVDTDRFHPNCKQNAPEIRKSLNLSPHDRVFLFVGSGFERKGLKTLLKAISLLPDTAKAVIIGEDKHRGRYEEYASRLGMRERVKFLGRKKEVIPYYGVADAFVLPTLYDPFPNVVLEAMACGLPVLTSTKSGGAEVIESGVEGYVHDALDYQGFSESMLKLMDRSHSNACGEAARKKIEPFTLDRMAENLNKLYSGLLSLQA
jgi:UDP-glucose:(heptosyl)LPS alpha-1,3-glucosyltransferase